MTPQLTALRNHILRNICPDVVLVNDMIDDIQLECANSWKFSMQHIFFEFQRRNIRFKSKKDIDKLLPYIVDVINNAQLWANCGHTPAEMKKIINSTDTKTKTTPFYVKADNEISITKIGRNDPCPCGSGKKHKKCCAN